MPEKRTTERETVRPPEIGVPVDAEGEAVSGFETGVARPNRTDRTSRGVGIEVPATYISRREVRTAEPSGTMGVTVLYTRTATTRSGGERSARKQRERALAYAADLGIDRTNVRVLTDRSTEARSDASSGYRRLLSLVDSGLVDRVLVTDASRIVKTMPEFYEFVDTVLSEGGAVHVIDAGIALGEDIPTARSDASQPDDETLLGALEIAAELEESVSAERTKEGIDAAKASGKHVGRPPFGFDSRDGRLVPNDDFETALEVIERIEAGKSKRSTAQRADISRATVQNIVDRKDLYLDHAAVPAAETGPDASASEDSASPG